MANNSEVIIVTHFIFWMQGSFLRVVEHFEFKNQHRSGGQIGWLITHSEVMKVTDFIFGMQGSFMRVVM